MGGILQVDTIQNNNATTLITQTNSTTLTFGVSGQNIVIPSGVTFNTASATVTLPTTIKVDTIQNTNSTNLITQTNVTTITFGATSQTISVPSVASFASTIGVGGATPSTSGAGITFPASASASSNANTLDDYEEGTWTPSDISGASLTLTGPVGNYVKIGKWVIVNYHWRFPSTASGTAINIGNLPFTAASGNDNYQGNVSTTDYGSSDIVIWNNAGSTNIRIRNYNDSALSNANLSGKYITGQSIYFI